MKKIAIRIVAALGCIVLAAFAGIILKAMGGKKA